MNNEHKLLYCTKIMNTLHKRLKNCNNLYDISFPQKYVWMSIKTTKLNQIFWEANIKEIRTTMLCINFPANKSFKNFLDLTLS